MIFLVGYTGSKESKAALALARDHAALFAAKVVVVVSSEGGPREKHGHIGKASEDLFFARNFLEEKGIEFDCHELVRGVSPGEDMVRYAEEKKIDQIFVGIEKKSRTQKIILGSNAQYIILKAPCPVVTVNR